MDIVIEDLEIRYGNVVAVENLALTVADGEMLVLLGPSGCGKTSTMRAIVGLERPTGGTITIGGQTVFDARTHVDIPTNKRRIGMVFQSYAIWPHKTVFQNIAFPLRMQRVPAEEIRQRVAATAELMELGPLLGRGASRLSGGQMQRVALARSIVMEPKVMLLDEPLSNLDAKLRDKLRLDLKDLQTELGITTIYVTHDQGEALALADRIAVMDKGRLVQLDAPETLYREPVNLKVADFLGVSNIFAGKITHAPDSALTEFTMADGAITLVSAQRDIPDSGQHSACLRPEAVRLRATPDGASGAGVNTWSGRVSTRSFVGTHTRYRVAFDNGAVVESVVPAGEPSIERDSRVTISIAPADVRILPC